MNFQQMSMISTRWYHLRTRFVDFVSTEKQLKAKWLNIRHDLVLYTSNILDTKILKWTDNRIAPAALIRGKNIFFPENWKRIFSFFHATWEWFWKFCYSFGIRQRKQLSMTLHDAIKIFNSNKSSSSLIIEKIFCGPKSSLNLKLKSTSESRI